MIILINYIYHTNYYLIQTKLSILKKHGYFLKQMFDLIALHILCLQRRKCLYMTVVYTYIRDSFSLKVRQI